jgi:hypothetical protein
MRRKWWLVSLALFVPLSASAQLGAGPSATPMVIDLKKVAIGSWAEYEMSVGPMKMKTTWSLVARDATSNTMEMSVEGGPMAMMGKMVMKMVMAPDPTATEKPVKQLIMQMGPQDPMEMPLEMPGSPATQTFQKPDPKNLVGKEEVTVGAGTFKTSHYRDQNEQETVDAWVSEEIPPLGLIKMTATPKPGSKTPDGEPMLPVSMELLARGKDAKSQITKPAKPFDPAMFGGPRPGGGAPPPPPPSAPPPAAPKKK